MYNAEVDEGCEPGLAVRLEESTVRLDRLGVVRLQIAELGSIEGMKTFDLADFGDGYDGAAG